MPIKTGEQYRQSLRDGRKLYIDGKLVEDVTNCPSLQGVIGTIAALHDDQHDPAYRDILTYASPSSGERVSKTYLEAKTLDELHGLAGCYHLRALRTFGLMGRLTDFMSGFLVDTVVGLRAMGRLEAAARAEYIVELCRENDLQVTHALIDPQTDRSKLDAPSQAVQLVERRADGIVVSGCRTLSTLAPVANECYVGPYYPRKAGEEKFALTFVIPMNTPGLSILGRESFHRGESEFRSSPERAIRRGRRHSDVRQGLRAERARDRRRRYRGLQRNHGHAPGLYVAPGLHAVGHEAALPGRHGDRRGAGQRSRQDSALPGSDRRTDRPRQHRRRHPLWRHRRRPPPGAGFRAGQVVDLRRWTLRSQGDRQPGQCGGQFLLSLCQHQGGRRAAPGRGLGRPCHERGRLQSSRCGAADGPVADRTRRRRKTSARADEARLGHDGHRVRLRARHSTSGFTRAIPRSMRSAGSPIPSQKTAKRWCTVCSKS